jgi:hypothetical protein
MKIWIGFIRLGMGSSGGGLVSKVMKFRVSGKGWDFLG